MDKKNGRPRAHYPEDQDDPLARYDCRVSYRQARIARKIGGGNFSAGVREALERVAADIEFINRVHTKK